MSEKVWYFGYGANMNVKNLEEQKKVSVIESAPAVLKGYRMAFTFKGFHLVEPGFAGLLLSPGSEVHGLAVYMDKESADILDKSEGHHNSSFGYGKELVSFKTYDGRDLEGFIFIGRDPNAKEYLPSKRYLNLVISGAKEAGLDDEYIKKLESQPTYTPSEATLKARELRPKPEDLPVITFDELSKNDNWTSCLGYVCKTEGKFPPHRGKEVTSSNLHSRTTDSEKPQFTLIKDMHPASLEYFTQFLDSYSLDENYKLKPFVGYLKEFREQQLGGSSL